jgi:type VI secretion system secreted protein Hcp
MAERWFLKIDGIAGESTHIKHEGEIEVLSWSWGISQSTPTQTGGGGASGKASFDELSVVTQISAASPPLLAACATGTHVPWAMLSCVRAGSAGRAKPFLTYHFTDVLIGSVHHGDDEGDVPSEQLTLRYATVEMSYLPQLATGKQGKAITFGFDVANNRPL